MHLWACTADSQSMRWACRFKAYSKFPPCYKDVAFWINDAFTENNLCEMVSELG